MKRLSVLLSILIHRWGWDRVVEADGELVLAEEEGLMERNRRSFYGGARSYVKAYCAEEISQRPSEAQFGLSRTAEREGIPPTTPPVLTEEALDALHKDWCLRPYLASEFPALEEGEYNLIKEAITHIREGTWDLLRTVDPAADSDESQSTLHPALIEASRRDEEGPKNAPAGPPHSADIGPSAPMAIPAKWLNDREWLLEFRSLIQGYVNTARDISRNGPLPGYPRQMRIDDLARHLGWLKQHLERAAEDRSRSASDEIFGVEAKLLRAFQWAHALVRTPEADSMPTEPRLTAWQSILELLENFDLDVCPMDPRGCAETSPSGGTLPPVGPPADPSPLAGTDGQTDGTGSADARPGPSTEGEPAAAGPAGTPREDRQAAGSDASGSEAPAPETLAQQIRRRWPRS
jgi:hypothetical protein